LGKVEQLEKVDRQDQIYEAIELEE
jgi:hypothetical protein